MIKMMKTKTMLERVISLRRMTPRRITLHLKG
jgi:hypothetical protein